jgi:signal transduction histidine kinase
MQMTSLRAKMLLIVLGGVVLPLGIVGTWLARTAQHSGEALLKGRLDSALVRAAQEAGDRWVTQRTELLRIADDTGVQRSLRESAAERAVESRIRIDAPAKGFAELRDATHLVVVSDRRRALWVLDADATGAPILVTASDSQRVGGASTTDMLPVRLAIYRGGTSDTLGVIEARFKPASLVPAVAARGAGAGVVFAVVDRGTRAIPVPLPFDPDLLTRDRFTWGGEQWLSESRRLDDPAIDLLAAAPSGAYTLPFEDAARRGLLALLVVAVAAVGVSTLLTRHATRSLIQLAEAADAVSLGDLERRVEPTTGDEVGRVARAFNAMTESLRRTLAELSQRQAVAAVGEFASALAHEIRNPLSAIRLNLQHVDERIAPDAPMRTPLGQALRDINRLEGTVAGALRVARTGQMAMEITDLRVPLEAAARAAAGEFARREARLEPLPDTLGGIRVRANGAALEQLFLNLLLNAAQASAPGARAGVRVDVAGEHVTVAVWDMGTGFASEARDRAFDPFYTTRAEGTGLGLTVARRIATAHGGTIEIESTIGAGATVRVQLPVARNPATVH